MSVAAAVRNGMGSGTAMRIWGEAVYRAMHGRDGILPDAFGWPSMSMEGRLRAYVGGAAQPGASVIVDDDGLSYGALTAPEAAVEALESDRAIASFVDAVLRDATNMQRIYARLRYVYGKCWADIAEQMQIEVAQVERMSDAVLVRVRRALRAVVLEAQAA